MPRRRWSDVWDRFAPSVPLAVKGGIRAHSARGAFAQTWWGKKWLAALERLVVGGRLARGRNYARRGQVLDVRIEEGRITASVQGSRREPYAVTIKVRKVSPEDWKRALARLGRETRLMAEVLAGRMPEEIEKAFAGASVSLLPAQRSDLATDCSCPDWANPCKHVAAVHYLLAEELDRDPFLLFRLRGSSREAVVASLGRAAKEPAAGAHVPAPAAPPLRADPVVFWRGAEDGDDAQRMADAEAPAGPALRGLGPFPFWRGRIDLRAALEPVYAAATSSERLR